MSESDIKMFFQGQPIIASRGQTIASALMKNGIKKFGEVDANHNARGYYCGTGRCYGCSVTVNKQRHVRSCITLAEQNMVIHFDCRELE